MSEKAPSVAQERRTDAGPTLDMASHVEGRSGALCACGCGVALTHRQAQRGNRFTSRACFARSSVATIWNTPEARKRQAEAARRGKLLARIDRWAQPAYDTMSKRIDADKLTRRETAAIKLVLADLVREMYTRGYRCGYSSRVQREKRRKERARLQRQGGAA